MSSSRAAATVAAAALLSAGCGGGESRTTTTTTGGGTSGSAAETLFVQKCGACHALDAAGTTGTFGGDLDEVRPSRDAVLKAIEGGPATMPEAILEGRDAEVVADYVARVASRNPPGAD